MQKYEFCIRTQTGQRIERLNIIGRDQTEAERKLRQMYRNCEIVRCEPYQKRLNFSQAGNGAAITDELAELLAK